MQDEIIAYLWADGEYIFECDLDGFEPEHAFGFTKSDDYYIVDSIRDLNDCKSCFQSDDDYLEFQTIFIDSIEHEMVIDNWAIVGEVVYGNVYGSSRFPDGELIKTSKIKTRIGNKIITSNSVYTLG